MPAISKTFTASVSTIRPSYSVDPVFMDLMIHTCTIVWANEATGTGGSYGHRVKDYTTMPRATYTGVRCRLRSLNNQEIVAIGRDEETIQDMMLYIPDALMPESLKEDTASARHEVSNVQTLQGELVKAGPFDVQSIRQIAGEQHHYLIQLRKAGQ